jgi:hypothetical protein
MSVTYQASLILGFELTAKSVKKTITKYDPDTGKPINKQVPGHLELYLGDLLIVSDEHDEEAIEDEGELEGLTLFMPDNKYILGKKLVEGPYSDRAVMEVPEEDIPEIQAFFNKYKVRPKLYLDQYIG